MADKIEDPGAGSAHGVSGSLLGGNDTENDDGHAVLQGDEVSSPDEIVVVEQHIIGPCLSDASLISQVEAICSVEKFYDPLHRRIIAAMQSLHAADTSVTPATVSAALGDDAGLAEVGGQCYLEAIVEQATSSDALALAKELAALTAPRDPQPTLGDNSPSLVSESYDILPTFSAAEFEGLPVPPREELVEDLIPAQKVTMFSGDGGVGKSLLGMQLAAAMQLHTNWLGKMVNKNGPVLFVSAEEDKDEMHRRLAAILADEGQSFRRLQHLHLVPLVGRDALLAERTDRGSLTPTELYGALKTRVATIKPDLVILDALADVFGGNEIDRTHARQFVGMLQRICIEEQTTILLLAHPSLTGLTTGSGTSGSTAWNNSVRSRLYLERIKNKDDSEDDPDRRVLKAMKANYAPTGGKISVRWERGVFKVINDGEENYATRTRHAKEDRIFLDCLATYTAEGRSVGPNPGANYAPAIFARDKSSEGIAKTRLLDAMNRLLKQKRIEIEEIGPASRRTSRLVIASTDA